MIKVRYLQPLIQLFKTDLFFINESEREIMMQQALKQLYIRDLKKLKVEIQSYNDHALLWSTLADIKNSGGNLCLHLIGNLKTYIGNGLLDIGYVRKREFEFTGKNVAREELIKEIDETIDIVSRGFDQLTSEQLAGDFPIVIWKEATGMAYTLIHLHSHLNYHLGQINYHRRIICTEYA